MTTANILLNVNGIEVIYNHVILVLKGVSLSVPEGSIVALLGGNGASNTNGKCNGTAYLHNTYRYNSDYVTNWRKYSI